MSLVPFIGLSRSASPQAALVTHLLIEQSTSPKDSCSTNLPFLIGTSFCPAGLYMPSNQAASIITKDKSYAEDQLAKILSRFAEFLGKGDGRTMLADRGVGWYPEDAFKILSI